MKVRVRWRREDAQMEEDNEISNRTKNKHLHQEHFEFVTELVALDWRERQEMHNRERELYTDSTRGHVNGDPG